MVAKIGQQITSCYNCTWRNRKWRIIKDTYRRCTRSGDKLLVIDGVKRFKENEENDPSQLNDKSELIKFAVKNLYEWHKQQKKLCKINKVTEYRWQ